MIYFFWVAVLIVMGLIALFVNPWAALFIGVLSLAATG